MANPGHCQRRELELGWVTEVDMLLRQDLK